MFSIFTRKRRIAAATVRRREAAALVADAKERGDTRALKAAQDQMREATTALMQAEGFGG